MTEYHGRIILTWPAPASAGVVMAWGLTAHDADTGEQIVDITSLNLAIGIPDSWDSGPLHVTVTRLVDAEGQPIGTGKGLVPTDEYAEHRNAEKAVKAVKADLPFTGQHFCTAVFRYLVAEMRTAEPKTPAAQDGRPTESSDTMTWSLNASGHTPTPDGADDWAEAEKELHAKLQEVLSDPRYGATHSHFSGNHVQAPVHLPAKPADEPEAETETEDQEHGDVHAHEDAPTHHQHHHHDS